MSEHGISKYRAWLSVMAAAVLCSQSAGLVSADPEPKAAAEEQALSPELNEAAMLYEKADELQKKGQYDAALPLAEKSLAIRKKALGPEHVLVAASLNTLGALLYLKGEHDRAMSSWQRALTIRDKALGPEHPDVAASLNNLASLHWSKGEWDKAMPLHQRALAIREKALGPEHPDVAQSLYNLANLHVRKGEWDNAMPLYQRALAILEKALGPEHPDVATSLHNLAVLHDSKGEWDTAMRLEQRGLAIREKALGPEHPDVAASLYNLANLHVRKGEWDKAMALHQRALTIWEKALGPEHPHVALSLDSLAVLHFRKGEWDKAMRLGQRGLAIREKALGPEHPHVAASLGNLANVHVRKGEWDKAMRLEQRGLAIREKALGPEHPDVALSLENLANLHVRKGEWDKAMPLYQFALAIMEKALSPEHPDVATLLHNLADLHVRKGEWDKAMRLEQRALVIREKALGPNHPRVAGSLHNLATLEWARGAIDQAMARYQAQNEAREAHFALVMATEAATTQRKFLSRSARELDTVITFALDAANRRAGQVAYTTLAQRKGRVLDSMTSALAALRTRLGPDDARLLDEYRGNRSQYAALLLRGAAPMPEDMYKALLDNLTRRAEELERDIGKRSVEFREWRQPIGLADIQAALPGDAVLIEWIQYQPYRHGLYKDDEQYGPPRYAVAIVRARGAPEWLDLGPAAPIDAAVTELRRALSAQLATVKDAARAVDALVMAPVRQRLAGKPSGLILAPDSALDLIPFGALVDEQGRYLLERHAITYLTSGRDLVRASGRAQPRSPGVIVANPRFDRPDAEPVRTFLPLDGTAGEARLVKAHFPAASVLSGQSASPEAVQAVRGPAFLHIATHGYFDSLPCGDAPAASPASNPMLDSGLALAGANACQLGDGKAEPDAQPRDGLLTALELAALDLHGTRLAVLSACDTGLGASEIREDPKWSTGRGQGLYGLRRALVLAGAETQLVSLWRVDDASTRDLMSAYYQKLAQGQPRGEAMRQVQLAMARGNERSHPYFWASFILSGQTGPMDLATPGQARPPTPRGQRGCACNVGTGQSSSPGPIGIFMIALLLLACCVRKKNQR